MLHLRRVLHKEGIVVIESNALSLVTYRVSRTLNGWRFLFAT